MLHALASPSRLEDSDLRVLELGAPLALENGGQENTINNDNTHHSDTNTIDTNNQQMP